jgi:hypothetical protein
MPKDSSVDKYSDLVTLLETEYSKPRESAYVTGRWKDRLTKAAKYAKRNKRTYYVVRIAFMSSAALAPLFVAAQTATFGLLQVFLHIAAIFFSFAATISAGYLEIRKPGQRWLLYQRLRYDLEQAGWALAESPEVLSADADGAPFKRFIDSTEDILKRHNVGYFTEIAHVTSAIPRSTQGTGTPPASRRRSDLPLTE